MKEYTNRTPMFSTQLRITETTDTDHADNINAAPIQVFENTLVLKAMLDAAATVTRELVIPTEGWQELPDGELPVARGEEGSFRMFCLDIPQEGMTESMIPMLTIVPTDAEIAKRCGMATTVQTMEGKLRVYAERPPETAIRVILVLFRASVVSEGGIPGEGTGDGSGGTGSETPEGGGSLPTVATEEEVEEMLEEIFGTENGAYVSEVATPEEVRELLEEVFEPDI